MEREILNKKIANLFDGFEKEVLNTDDLKNLPSSAKAQIKQILASEAKVALDIGSGRGGILFELLDGGVQKVVGVDLSPKMIDLSRKLLEDKFSNDRFDLNNDDFLSIDLPSELDAVSLHKVLCCHPDKIGIIEKCSEQNPPIITLTIPRNWFIARIFVVGIAAFSRIFNTWRFFIHSQKKVDHHLSSLGYNKIDEIKGKIWVTSTYRREV